VTREAIRGTLTDRQALIATLYGEAAGESRDGQIAVACVIRNRVRAPGGWGRTYRGVCLAPAQFSCWWETNANSDRVYLLAEDLLLVRPPSDAALVAELGWIADGVMGEAVRDHLGGATNYLTAALFETAPPSWARGRVPVARLGRHVFFAGVA
jgi:hypothetical protein